MSDLKKRHKTWINKLGPTARFSLCHGKDTSRLLGECITGLDHTYTLEFGGVKFLLTHPYRNEAPFHNGEAITRKWQKESLPADLCFQFMELPKGVGIYGFDTFVYLGFRRVNTPMVEELLARLTACHRCASACAGDAVGAPRKGDFPQLHCRDCGNIWPFYGVETV